MTDEQGLEDREIVGEEWVKWVGVGQNILEQMMGMSCNDGLNILLWVVAHILVNADDYPLDRAKDCNVTLQRFVRERLEADKATIN